MPKAIKLTSRDKELLEEIRMRLVHHLQDPVSISSLCRKSGLNEEKVKKGFKLLYGLPPHAFHRHLRMQEAERLLRDTELTVREIACAVGYDSMPGFCKAFRRFHGVNALVWKSMQPAKDSSAGQK